MPGRFLSASLFRLSLISRQKLAVTALSAEAARLRHHDNAPRCRSASRRSARHRHSSRSLRSSSWFTLSPASMSFIARNSASATASRENREGCKTHDPISPRTRTVAAQSSACELKPPRLLTLHSARLLTDPFKETNAITDIGTHPCGQTRTTVTRKGYPIANRRIARALAGPIATASRHCQCGSWRVFYSDPVRRLRWWICKSPQSARLRISSRAPASRAPPELIRLARPSALELRQTELCSLSISGDCFKRPAPI
jgi:hypothetical protein